MNTPVARTGWMQSRAVARLAMAAFAVATVFPVVKVVQVAGRIDPAPGQPLAVMPDDRVDDAVAQLNTWFREQWAADGVMVAPAADDVTVFRRLNLALFGTAPSLEDLRVFEADSNPDRIDRWVSRMLQDSRYSDYFAERLARALVGVEDGPFIIFRRDRLTSWLSRQLREDASWSAMTRELIAGEGLWTDRPAANFITVARIDDEGLDENKLAGRTVRAFLGQRIDCAQCHDHPFDEHWKQSHFEGFAAFYGQAGINLGGVSDFPLDDNKQTVEYKVVDPGQDESHARVIAPSVPFNDNWIQPGGSRRSQLADWVTHPENRRYERAIANRVWGFLFGRSLHEPVDDLPHPDEATVDALDILGREFRRRGDRLSTLIRMIASSDVYRLSSELPAADEHSWSTAVEAWSVFPLVRLRPEQVIGSLFQAAHIRTVDQNSNPLIRVQKFGNENDFLKEYGDLGDDELLQQVGTIPQALLRMNGRFTQELSNVDLLTASGEILRFSESDEAVIENCYLACLTRRPDAQELEFFKRKLTAKVAGEADDPSAEPSEPPASERRQQAVEDLYWSLFNSPEFSWNH